MWPFSRKQKKSQGLPIMTALIDDRELKELSENTEVLRVWLPEAGRTALDEITERTGMVAAKYLREFFVIYLYGMHELLKMQTTSEGLYYIQPPNPPRPPEESNTEKNLNQDVFFSRAPTVECIPGLGKNIIPLKVFLPARIKNDLQVLADKVGIPLSQFTREVLVAHCFGHTFYPEKLKTWSDDQEWIGVEWEQGVRESENISHFDESRTDADGISVVRRLEEF
jgi:hypothetical protein